MDEISKYYCFGFLEFEVMRSVYEIESLTFFKSSYSGMDCDIQSEYNRGVLGLYQKKYLNVKDESWTVRDEIAKIFYILKGVSHTISMESKDEEVAEYLLFFSNKYPAYFVIGQPGTQKEEYVKLRLCLTSRFQIFLEESGALFSESLPYELLKNQEIIPVEDDLERIMEKRSLIKKEELWEEKNIKTLFCINAGCGNPMMIGLVKQSLQDKILLCEKDDIKLYIYSSDMVVQILWDAMEVKEK